jgi:hypothetical protein
MSAIANRNGAAWLAQAAFCICVGVALAVNPQLGLILAVAAVGVFALAAPPYWWVLSALIASLTFKGLVTLGALPSVATYLDLPLAWGALAAALMRGRDDYNRFAAKYLRWLALLSVAVLAAWIMNPSELIRPIVYLFLLGQPFAIVAALLVAPPSPKARKVLLGAAAVLIAVQVPLAYFQFATHANPDDVQGTLLGAGAGAHVMSAVVAVGAFWVLSGIRNRFSWWRLALVTLMLGVLFIADAKQVIFALPAFVLGVSILASRLVFAVRSLAAIIAIVGLVSLPAGQIAVRYLESNRSGQSGKQATAEFIWRSAKSDPPSLVFGNGPAETVSRAAFMTTEGFLQPDSPIRVLQLAPAKAALEAQGLALARSGGGTSANTGVSSALGVFGDLGLFGALAYAGLVVLTLKKLRRYVSPEGQAAAGGWAMFVVLGFVFDWWEQPPLSVLLALLAGVALTSSAADSLELSSEPTGGGRRAR